MVIAVCFALIHELDEFISQGCSAHTVINAAGVIHARTVRNAFISAKGNVGLKEASKFFRFTV